MKIFLLFYAQNKFHIYYNYLLKGNRSWLQTPVAKLATFVAVLVTQTFSTCHGNQKGDTLEHWTTHIVYYCKIMLYWNLFIEFDLWQNTYYI